MPNFEGFARRVGFRTKKMTQNLEKTVRRAAIAADAQLVMRTPVEFGRARANWLASVGRPDTSVVDNVDPDGTATMLAAQGVIAGWKIGRGSIFITNSLPYIVPLDNGHSWQAREGMTPFAIQAARLVFKRARIL